MKHPGDVFTVGLKEHESPCCPPGQRPAASGFTQRLLGGEILSQLPSRKEAGPHRWAGAGRSAHGGRGRRGRAGTAPRLPGNRPRKSRETLRRRRRRCRERVKDGGGRRRRRGGRGGAEGGGAAAPERAGLAGAANGGAGARRRGRRGRGVWNRPGRGRASPDRLGDRTVIPAPRVRPRRRAGQRRRWKQVSEPGCQWCPCLVSPPPHLQFKKQLLMAFGGLGVSWVLHRLMLRSDSLQKKALLWPWGNRVTAWAGLILFVLDAVCGSITYV